MNNLHIVNYEDVDGTWMRVTQEEMFIYAAVEIATGEVYLDDIRFREDQFYTLNKGFEWRKFKVTPV